MENLISYYYEEFESYKNIWKLKNAYFVSFIISLVAYFLILYFFISNLKSVPQSLELVFVGFMMVFQIITVMLAYKLQEQRNEKVLNKYRKIFKNENLTLIQIKKRWFKEVLVVPNTEYIDLIEKVQKYYSLKSQFRGMNLTRDKFYNFIFSTDSKNRVIGMFMGLVALFSALLISNGVDIDYIFSLFEWVSFPLVTFIILAICFLIFGMFYMLKYVFLITLNYIDLIFDNSVNNRKITKRKKDVFIDQLLILSEFQKHRKRMYASLQVSKKLDSDTVE